MTVFRYCGHLTGDSWRDLVLAAGTVFNKVVIWPVAPVAGTKCVTTVTKETDTDSFDIRNSYGSHPVDIAHTLSGHKVLMTSSL